MKLIDDIILTDAGGETLAVPVGATAEKLHGVIRLNETGKVIFQALKDGLDEDQIAARLTEQFEVDEATALQDTRDMLAQLRAAGLIEE